jgi:DNA-binding transcriptional LysR family regulator
VRPLNRDRRGVTLSQAGETLRDSVDANFQQVEQALRIARDGAGYESFKISVGRIEDANLPFIPLALIRFQALYPDITVERHETNTAQQIVTPKRNSIDLGLGLPAGSLLNDVEILMESPLESSRALSVRSDHRLANIDCLNLVDLVHERLITSARGKCSALQPDRSAFPKRRPQAKFRLRNLAVAGRNYVDRTGTGSSDRCDEPVHIITADNQISVHQ